MEAAKEAAANVAASALSGMEKTKAVVAEKAEKLTTSNPVQRQMATEKKEQKIHQAEVGKLAAQEQNAASRLAASTGGTTAYTAIGDGVVLGHTTGTTHGTTTGHTGLGRTTGTTHGTTTGPTGLGHATGAHGTTTGNTDLGHATGIHGSVVGHAPAPGVISTHDPVAENTTGVTPGGVATEYLTGTTMGVVGSQYPPGTTAEGGGATVEGPNTHGRHGTSTGSPFN